MSVRDRKAETIEFLRHRWPILARSALLISAIAVIPVVVRPAWLWHGDAGALAFVSGFTAFALSALVMAGGRAYRDRDSPRAWFLAAAGFLILFLFAWFDFRGYHSTHVRYMVAAGFGQWGVVGDEPNADTADRVKDLGAARLTDLNDEQLADLGTDFPPDLNPTMSGPGDRLQLLCTTRSFEAARSRLGFGLVATTGLFVLSLTALVESGAALARRRRLPPIVLPRGLFISYRQLDSAAATDLIREHLARRIDPDRIFLDLHTIEAAEGIDTRIAKALGSTDVVLEVIGRQWLDIVDGAGRRKLDDPNDWVRKEIEAAIALNLPIIPVLVDGATMPPEAMLPPSIAGLARLKGLPVRRYPDFQGDLRRLGDAIARLAASRS